MATSAVETFVFEGQRRGGDLRWAESPRRTSLDELCRAVRSSRGITIGFVPDIDDWPAEESTATSCARLSAAFGTPALFWTELCDKASGFYGAKGPFADDDRYTAMMRFLIKQPTSSYATIPPEYRWDKIAMLSSQDSNGISMLCLGFDLELRRRMCRAIANVVGHLDWTKLLLSIQAATLVELVREFDTSVWNWRDQIRSIEKGRSLGPHQALPTNFFAHMHEISRHIVHCTEMISTGIAVVQSFRQEVMKFPGAGDVLQEVDLCLSLLACLSHRSQALEKRHQNEINLAFHNNSQYSSIVNQRISEMAQQDGRVSRGISVLGMVFLPGTFVSAIFSMTFFQTEHLIVSGEFWIYWVVTIPLTALTLGTWFFWQRISDGRKQLPQV